MATKSLILVFKTKKQNKKNHTTHKQTQQHTHTHKLHEVSLPKIVHHSASGSYRTKER